jgi:hypothetical protein
VLFLLPWVTALVLRRGHHHVDVAGVVIPVSFGLLTGWLAWATYRGRKRSGSLAQVADQLAAKVEKQWTKEAKMRGLDKPYPLPVSWDAADPSLTDAWDTLVKLAASGAGWPTPPPAGTWAAGPDDLAGKDRELIEVLSRVPTGRLVVLGEPGAGKTVLMIRLVLDLLVRRREIGRGPVPILVSVAFWKPTQQDLRSWLTSQLLTGHRALANPPPAGREESTLAAALLADGLILPILDGLDEIEEQYRGPAITLINDVLRPGQQAVVTCRAREYQDSVRPEGGVEATFRGAAAVQLRPLDADVVGSYLCADAGGPDARARWDPVLQVLGTEAPAGQALTTPLMVGLARAIYNPRQGGRAREVPNPAELCGFADRSVVEAHLFDAFIPAAYQQSPGRWTAEQAEPWLVCLASIGLAWWGPLDAVPRAAKGGEYGPAPLRVADRPAVGLAVGLTSGIAAALIVGVMAGLASAFAVGGAFAVGAGLMASLVVNVAGWQPSRRKRLSIWLIPYGVVPGGILAGLMGGLKAGIVAGITGGLMAGILFGILFGLLFVFKVIPLNPRPGWDSPPPIFSFALEVGIAAGVAAGIVVGAAAALGGVSPAVGIAAGLAVGLLLVLAPIWDRPGDPPGGRGPEWSGGATLALERRTALLLGLMTGIAAGLMAWVVAKVVATFGAAEVVTGFLAGLTFGLVAGCCFGFITTKTTWPSYILARGWLARHHRLPWRLSSFLSDAHHRGVLRQVGEVYQFRHIELQHRLANRDADKHEASPIRP